MAFDRAYPNRKDQRAPHHGSKAFDRTCRNHGSCPYCQRGRLHQYTKAKERAEDELRDTLTIESATNHDADAR
jgi:hypothetical protein